VVEIGAIRFDIDGRERGCYQRLVNPCRPMPRAAQAIHGLSDADLAGAPRAADLLPDLLTFLGDQQSTILLAHTAGFDPGFLGTELAIGGLSAPCYEVVDTLAPARKRWPEAPAHRLDALAAALGLVLDDSHRALADCRRVKGLWLALIGGPIPFQWPTP